jgi:L-threonylcarbamoyladenylate synthase
LERHYAPNTLMVPAGQRVTLSAGQRWGYLAYQNVPEGLWASTQTLSPTGNAAEAASNLFAALHSLDEAGLDGIVFESAPDQGLGRAINDRLKRASHSKHS